MVIASTSPKDLLPSGPVPKVPGSDSSALRSGNEAAPAGAHRVHFAGGKRRASRPISFASLTSRITLQDPIRSPAEGLAAAGRAILIQTRGID